MPYEDKNFGGSLVLDFKKWWRHVKTIYWLTKSRPMCVCQSEQTHSFLDQSGGECCIILSRGFHAGWFSRALRWFRVSALSPLRLLGTRC